MLTIFYKTMLFISKIKSKSRVLSIIVFVLHFLFVTNTFAQETWTLTRCVDYALENNIDVLVAYNSVKTQKINLNESKAALLPDLSLGSQLNMNFGRNIDPNTNDVTFNQTLQNYYWVNTSVNIFQGLVKMNSIRFNNYLFAAHKEEATIAKNQLIFKILISYYTVLYGLEMVDVAHNQVNISENQIKRIEKFVDVGKESPIIIQELKSQDASEKLNLTHAQNFYTKTLLELKQLLRLDAGTPFTIDKTNNLVISIESVPNIDSLFQEAVELMPQIKQQQLLFNASEKELAMAKGYVFPHIYMSAGYSTNFFNGSDMVFPEQLNNNQNQWVSVGIGIPVFKNTTLHSNIKRKQIAVLNQKLNIEKEREKLYAEVWKAVDALASAQNEYASAVELSKYSELTLKNISVKMEKGLASATDYDIAKQRNISAKTTLLKAKLIYLMRKQMLDFYRSGNWNHLYVNSNMK